MQPSTSWNQRASGNALLSLAHPTKSQGPAVVLIQYTHNVTHIIACCETKHYCAMVTSLTLKKNKAQANPTIAVSD